MRSLSLLGLLCTCILTNAQSFLFSPSFPGNSGEYGGGVTVYDINNDGWDDVSYPTVDDSVHTYINNQGVFELHRFFAQNGDGRQIVFGDYDNDGDADAIIATSGGYPSLYEQVGDLEFVDVSYKIEIPGAATSFLSGCNFVDFNQDGWLDVYVSNYVYTSASRCYVFINNGDGTFVESAASYGLISDNRYVFNSVFADFNNDQKLDFWVGNDRSHKEQLFLQGEGYNYIQTFPDANQSMIINTMSLSPYDYDRDGDLDMFLSNSEAGNCLMNNSAGTFVNVADGTPFELNRFCWGALWIDLYNDMWPDLLVATRENYLFLQTKDAFLINNQGSITNLDNVFSFNDVDGTYAFAKGDFNNDFRSDFCMSHDGLSQNEYILNDFTQTHAVGVKLEGTNCNRDGFGSQIHYFVNGQQFNDNLYSGYGYCSQNSKRFLLACGNHTGIDSLQVVWPNGVSEWWYNLVPQNNYLLKEGEGDKVFTNWENQYAICPNESVILTLPLGLVGTWSNGALGNEITISDPGVYFAVINGFSQTQSVTITFEENALTDLFFTPPICNNEATGRIELTNGAELNVMINGSTAMLPAQNLTSGTYTIEWMSTGGCVFSEQVELIEPLALSAEISSTELVCLENQFSTVDIESVTNFSFPFDATVNGVQIVSIENADALPMYIPLNYAGAYELVLTDNEGCNFSTTFIVDIAPVIQATITQTEGGENGVFVAEVSTTGGVPPLQFYWDNGFVSTQSSYDVTGPVNCTITDALGCTVHVESELTQVNELASSIVQSGARFSSSCNLESVVVIDALGKRVAQFKNTRDWSLDTLASGVYYLLLNNKESMNVWIGTNDK